MANISDKSEVHSNANIGENVTIGPFCYIEEGVEIGAGTKIHPNVTIYSGVKIGENCCIFPGAVIGAIPQDLKYEGEDTTVVVGNNTTIREYVTINKGTKASGTTVIGNDCLLMAYVHVAHDCVLGNHVILANDVNLAGHVVIEDWAILEGLVAVQQFLRIGRHSFIGGASLVRKNVPPYVKAAREPLSYMGVNTVGLLRRNFTKETIHNIENIYREIFVRKQNLTAALGVIADEYDESEARKHILEFIQQAIAKDKKNSDSKGIIRGVNASYNGTENHNTNGKGGYKIPAKAQ